MLCRHCHTDNLPGAHFCMHCGRKLTPESGAPLADRRVAVTGIGAVTPLGPTAEATWQALLAGRSGIGRITRFDTSTYPVQIAGEVHDFDPTLYIDRREVRHMPLYAQFALAAVCQAVADSGLDFEHEDGNRVGLCIGTGAGGVVMQGEMGARTLIEKGGQRVGPYVVIGASPNMASFYIARRFGLHGPSLTVTTACAAGTQALGMGAQLIRNGEADVVIAGGTESGITEVNLASLCALRALSTRNDQPERASRPFDKNRDGFVAAEGAGLLVLESPAHAQARGARIYGYLLGQAATNDAFHEVAPEPTGRYAAEAMRRALADAGLAPEAVDYVNAHATATVVGDPAEVLAIKAVLGPRAASVPVSATKSMTGHLIGAAGAVEAIACLLSMRDNVIHPTINYETPDPDCDIDCVPNVARPARINVAISNSFGFGGQNAVIVLGRSGGE